MGKHTHRQDRRQRAKLHRRLELKYHSKVLDQTFIDLDDLRIQAF